MKLGISNVRTEGFGANYRDPTVKSINKHFDKIKELILGAERTLTPNYVKKLIENDVEEIEKLVRMRFGFSIKIVNSTTLLATRVVAPKTEHSFKNIKTLYNTLNDMLKKNPNDAVKIKEYLDNIDSIDDWLKEAKLKVNTKTLHIENVPSSYRPEVYINFVELFKYKKVSASELTGGFLHEVGHLFTFLAFSYRTRTKKLAFEEAIKDSINKGNMSGQTILVAYSEAFDVDKKDKSKCEEIDTDTIKGLLDATKLILNNVTKDYYDKNKTDMEYIADAFATSLGYGKELTSLLMKLEINGIIAIRRNLERMYVTHLVSVVVVPLLLLAICYIINSGLAVLFLSYILSFLLGAVIGCFLVVFIHILASSHIEKRNNYDPPTLRLEKIRRVLICNLNDLYNRKAEREIIDSLLEDINEVDEHISMMKKKLEAGFLESIVEYLLGLSSKYASSKEMKNFKDSIEQLMHNDLHIAKAKLNGVLR